MSNIGDFNTLKVIKDRDFGYFLQDRDTEILIPKNSCEGRTLTIDEMVEVFVYRDSSDRPIATLKTPLAKVYDIAYLKVESVTNIGAFINIGLERDVMVPIKEQTYKITPGNFYMFYLYLDKTGRLAATLDIERHLKTDSTYVVGDEVQGTVFGFTSVGSALISVDNKYKGLILKNEFFNYLKFGEKLTLRVNNIYQDGVMSLSPRTNTLKGERLAIEDVIINYLNDNAGFMPYGDKSSPDDISRAFNTSKNYFKKALGGLMKKNLVTQKEDGTYLNK